MSAHVSQTSFGGETSGSVAYLEQGKQQRQLCWISLGFVMCKRELRRLQILQLFYES